MKYLIFDTETSGLPKTKIINPQTLNLWCHIVQFSYIIFDDKLDKLIKINDNIIKIPENIIISEETSKINGITNKICMDEGKNVEGIIIEFFEDLIDCDLLIGHNISFDINILKIELLRLINNRGNEEPSNKNLEKVDEEFLEKINNYKYYLYLLENYKNIYCTLENSIEICNIKKVNKYGKTYLKYPKLIELHEKLFNSIPNNLHNSLNDILITLRCFIKMKFDKDIYETSNEFKKLVKKYKFLN
jgi:DNA polymerase III epsilon subunit-like protein